jgi:hypothetical protein
MTEFKIKGVSKGFIEAELRPNQRKEASMWLLYLLDKPNFVVKYNLKSNQKGEVKVKLLLRNRLDANQLIEGVKLQVVSLITKSEKLNKD